MKVSMVWAVLLILMAVFVVVAVAIGSAGYSFTSIVQTLYRQLPARVSRKRRARSWWWCSACVCPGCSWL